MEEIEKQEAEVSGDEYMASNKNVSGRRNFGMRKAALKASMSRGQFLRTAGIAGGAVAAAGLGFEGVAKAAGSSCSRASATIKIEGNLPIDWQFFTFTDVYGNQSTFTFRSYLTIEDPFIFIIDAYTIPVDKEDGTPLTPDELAAAIRKKIFIASYYYPVLSGTVQTPIITIWQGRDGSAGNTAIDNGSALTISAAFTEGQGPTGCYPSEYGVRYVPKDYLTIQEALSAASPGDRISIAPGNYAGAYIWGIDGNKDGIKIIGSGQDKTFITKGEPTPFWNAALIAGPYGVKANNIVISNLTIDGGPYPEGNPYIPEEYVPKLNISAAIYGFGDCNNWNINNVTIKNVWEGITNTGGSGWNISNNNLYNAGIWVGALELRGFSMKNNTISNNRIYLGKINGNVIFEGITIDNKELPLDATVNNTISNNTISGFGFNGILLIGASYCKVTGNDLTGLTTDYAQTIVVANNSAFGSNKYGPSAYLGMGVYQSNISTFTNENFMGNYPGFGSGAGCVLFGDGARNNSISALKNGIALQGIAVCDQISELPDYFYSAPDSPKSILPARVIPEAGDYEYFVYLDEFPFAVYLEYYFPPLEPGFQNPADLRTALGYQRQNLNDILDWFSYSMIMSIPKTVETITLQGTYGNTIVLPKPQRIWNLEYDPNDSGYPYPEYIDLTTAPLPPILKNDKIPGFDKCLNKTPAFLASMRQKADTVNNKILQNRNKHLDHMLDLKARLEKKLGRPLPNFPTNKQ